MTRSLRLATAATAALVGGSFLLRLLNPFGAPPADPSDLVPHLWGIGALLVVLLTHSWAPTIAWCANIIGVVRVRAGGGRPGARGAARRTAASRCRC